MKRLRQLCAGLILIFALSAGALAGQVNCPGITASSQETVADSVQPQDNVVGKSMGAVPPAESNLASGVTATGEMQYGLLLLILALI